jgi:hypothetical protein
MGVVIRRLWWVVLVAACEDPRTAFVCIDSDGCRDGANQGTCQPTGFCSFPAPECPSGTRYGDASDELANACVDPRPVSAERSTISATAATIVACNATVITVVTRDVDDQPVTVGGHAVTMTVAGGTGGTLSAVVDRGDGTYTSVLYGSTAGATLAVTATVDGDPVLATANVVVGSASIPGTGLILHLDASRAAGTCAPPAGDQWIDLRAAATGTLEGFSAPNCQAGASGWCGDGTLDDPFRIAFDGAVDLVDFGLVAGASDYTVAAWVRRRGAGSITSSGSGGIDLVPIVAKGAADTEQVDKDINYMVGFTASGIVATDFERDPDSLNQPFTGARTLADMGWHHVAVTYNGATRVIYVDGAIDAQQPLAATPSISNLSRFAVGTSRTSMLASRGHLLGDLAVVAVYNRALSATDVAQMCSRDAIRFAGATCP